MDTSAIEAELREAFPDRTVVGPIAPYDCDECRLLQQYLGTRTWTAIDAAFVRQNDDVLPLLSREAYATFLPAWLLEAVREPSDGVAGMVLVNLAATQMVEDFTARQAAVVVEVARFITANSMWGPSDPVSIDSLAAVRAKWVRTVSQ